MTTLVARIMKCKTVLNCKNVWPTILLEGRDIECVLDVKFGSKKWAAAIPCRVDVDRMLTGPLF